MDIEISHLAAGTPSEIKTGLLESWAELVEILALGPAPEMRECPACRRRGMRAATRCGFCWTTLPPLARCENERGATRTLDGG